MHARLRGSKSLLTLYQIINKTGFPFLEADEIAEQRPDMNIKVAAFTVSEKSSNNLGQYSLANPPLFDCRPSLLYTHRTTNCFDDRLLFRRQMQLDFAGKG